MQVPILSGVYVSSAPDVRIAYPVNKVPVPTQDSVAEGYLRPAEGIRNFTTGQGLDRGSIVWNGVHYRVSGTKLISITAAGVVTILGDVGGSGPARMDFAFDRLAIVSAGKLWYWDGTTLTFVSDPNIGTVIDMVWVDGYFMVTDGTYITVTNINDPDTVNPTKYGSTDEPDPVKGLLKVQNESHVISEHFIDVFQDTGGANFPFTRLPTARISKGAVGTFAACVFQDSVVFVGSGRGEAPSVYQGKNAQFNKISTREIDNLLLTYTSAQLATITVQSMFDRGSQFVFINLPDRTIVYDAAASVVAQEPVWHIRTSSLLGFSRYRIVNIVRFNDQWFAGDPLGTSIGVLTVDDSSHWGNPVRWEFSTGMLRNDGKGAIVHQIELVALTGTAPVQPAPYEPMITTSYSKDGVTWSSDKAIKSGVYGDRKKRLVWFQQGQWRNYRIQRFRGDSTSRLSVLRLEVQIEPLAY